jgi:hypothetical protein
MVAFAEPLWLLGLAAVAVPVALHLRGERPGRVVRVGSVRWLEGVPSAWTPAPRLTRVPLLLLRCAVLAALALALAGPYRTGPSGASSSAWVLVAPEVVRRAPLDSLRRLGALRLLAPGLPALDAVPRVSRDSPTDVWSLLREADVRASAGTRFVVVAPRTLRFLRGVRPELRRDVDWLAVAAEPSRPDGSGEGGAVTIFASPERQDDARYLAAAFRAAVAARGANDEVVVLSIADSMQASGTPWIAWLGAWPVPALLERRVAEGARLVTDGDTTVLAAGDRVIWRGPDGGPLLVARSRGHGMHYRLSGRFHPSALPAVVRPEFADWIDTLWAPAPLRRAAPDLRVSRLQGVAAAGDSPRGAPLEAPPPLERRSPAAVMLLLLAALCWIAERAITAREPAA